MLAIYMQIFKCEFTTIKVHHENLIGVFVAYINEFHLERGKGTGKVFIELGSITTNFRKVLLQNICMGFIRSCITFLFYKQLFGYIFISSRLFISFLLFIFTTFKMIFKPISLTYSFCN